MVQGFFASARKYVVVGASNNPIKIGNRVLKWYISHELPVTPINPTSKTILGIPVQSSLASFFNADPSISDAAVSVITPPKVSLDVFRNAVESGNGIKIKSIWFQPGSFDDNVIKYCKENLHLSQEGGSLIADGDCILVSGGYKLQQSLKP